MATCVAAGTFDGIHPGHAAFLQQARDLGDELTVIVARDQTVVRLKGHWPVRNETDRLAAIQALPMVTRAILGSMRSDYLASVVTLKPDVLALGYDQWPDEGKIKQQLGERGLPNVRIVRLAAFKPERYHSSLLKDRR